MADVSLKHINKIYDNNVQAVFDFNLEIKDKEFIVFVGPSGCGKSTTLRMVAGLEDITNGELYIDGKYSNNLAPQSRDIGMVFQNYALYPHMTVYDNMAFGLRNRKVPVPILVEREKTEEELIIEEEKIKELNANTSLSQKEFQKALKAITAPKTTQKIGKDVGMLKRILKEIDSLEKQVAKDPDNKVLQEEIVDLEYWYKYFNENDVPLYKLGHLPEEEIDRRIIEAAKILDISQYLKRKPRALSGGQCQRVALGRAIVRHAKVFLMDEPLSNLDAKLRVQMRSEIIKLHKRIGATTIYVTHDQTEAMTMADRIVCMKFGKIQQIGTPDEIYDKPSNRFVATFIGSPAMNIINAKYKDGKVFSGDISYDLNKKEEELLKHIIYQNKEMFNKDLAKANSNIQLVEHKHRFKSKAVKADLAKLSAERDKIQEKIDAYDKYFSTNEIDMLLGFRAEHAEISKTPKSGWIKGDVDVTEMMGESIVIHAHVNDNDVLLKVDKSFDVKNLDVIYFTFPREKLYIFEGVSEAALYIDNDN